MGKVAGRRREQLTVVVTRQARSVVVTPVGVIDIASSPLLESTLVGLVNRDVDEIVVDLQGVRILDAASIGSLVTSWRLAAVDDVRLRVVHARGMVLTALEIVGVLDVLTGTDEQSSR